jgi:serine/threonine protein kinase
VAIENNELLGKVLGTYTLQHLLGRGGMGVVYLARQSRPRRTVAVKVLIPGMHTDLKARAEFLVRFRREADAIAALDHINIMPIYEYGEQGEMAYLVMPFVTGGTLRTLLEKKGILSLAEVVPIVEQAAAALDGAHAQGIIHRDLKPGNILFHADGRILLADFGLAKVVRGNEDSSSSDSLTTLTSVGTIIGTPEYLSPEQSTGQPIGPYTDIYALGIVLYQMLGGHVPFTGASPVTIALKHTMEMPPSLLALNPTLPPEVEAIVMKALAKLPEERFTSAGELARALRVAASDSLPVSGQLHSNRAPITIPDRSIPGKRTTKDSANAPTEEYQFVVPPEESTTNDAQKLTEENTSGTQSDSISKLPTEEQPSITLAEEALLPEYRVQTHVHSKAPDLHASETVEAPLPMTFESLTPPVQQASPLIAPPPVLARQTRTASPPKFTDNPSTTPRRGYQSMRMMLLGSLLTLILVVGGFIIYLTVSPKGSTTHPLQTTGTHQGTPKTTRTQPFTPPVAQVTAGSAVYGTASPGPQCDSQGGQWSKQAGVSITCATKGGWTQLTNAGGNTAGIFLNKLPEGKEIPNDYVIQVEVNISSTHGQFGVFVRNQPGALTGADSFIIDPATNTATRNEYDNQTGATAMLQNFQVGNLGNTITVDVTVQGSAYNLYINGASQGATQSARYSGGNLGLVVDAGATVSLRNMVIYAL